MNDFHHFLHQIHHKPGLYLGKPSISALYMFLNGYRFRGLELNLPLSEEECQFRNFQPWLQERFRIKTSQYPQGTLSWSQIILFHCSDEKEAFEYFFTLLTEFLHDKKLALTSSMSLSSKHEQELRMPIIQQPVPLAN